MYALAPGPHGGTSAKVAPTVLVQLDTATRTTHFPTKTMLCGILFAKIFGAVFFSCVIRGFADALSKGVARIFFPSKCWTALFTLPTTPNRKQDAQRMQTRRAVQQNDLAIYNKFLEKVSMMGQISTESVTHISLQLRTMWYRSLYLAPRHIPKTLPMA